MHITATSKNGTVTLYLPRSFRGFLTLSSKNGSVVFSEEFSRCVTRFSDVSHTERSFVGDLSSWVDRDEEWQGDEVIATSPNGRVKLLYIDEVKVEKDKKKFFSRVFGI
jgi:hypothetical protein